MDALLARAERFKYAVVHGNQTVATDLIIKPYQVTSNRPRRAELWNLTQQRRFLTELAVNYGELQRAEAELSDKLASAVCPRKADKRRVTALHAEYQELVQRTRRRAEDCMNNPRRECTGRGLAGVDRERHRKTMALCP